jgi:putative redox protein
MAEDKTAVATIGLETYRTELRARKHVLTADEPPEAGGTDMGPRPGDFLRMSLASCTAITLRMYANRKGFHVDHIRVEVSSEELAGKTVFHSEVEIKGQLSDEQRSGMIQIAKRCPVHKALTNPIEIETSLSVIAA